MKYTTEQWAMIDSIPQSDLARYMNKLSKTKLVGGSDWYQLCCINVQWREKKYMTAKQRRWATCLLLDKWDELSALDEIFHI